jgi:predicted transposase YdaD
MEYITSVEKIGYERGLKVGREIGRRERQEYLETIARKLLEGGVTFEVVRKATKLTIKRLKQIQADLQVNPIDGESAD